MSNKTIVIIDDDQDAIVLLRRILAATGVTIISYNNGKEFLENLIRVKARIGLILLDLNMPGVNGLVILKKMQEMRKFTKFKVCVLSAYNDPAVIAKATELGADEFLIKPIDKTALLVVVRDLLTMQNIVMGEDNFARVHFQASLLNSPLLLSFNIVGITPEKILMECIFNFKAESDIDFSCKQLCEAINCENEFTAKVIKSVSAKNKFMIAADFVNMTSLQVQNLKMYIAQYAQKEISFYDSLES
ncbi:MAG: response regulator [Bdellovibrionota bacterium]